MRQRERNSTSIRAIGIWIGLSGLIVIILVGCGGGSSESAASDLPIEVATATVEGQLPDEAETVEAVDEDGSDESEEALPLTLNINLTVNGPQPDSIFVPSDRPVQLVLRNRGRTEYHYKVEGLVPSEIKWISEPEAEVTREVDVSDEDHEAHHEADFVPWRATSRSGIQPTGEEVHGYAQVGELDVIRFTTSRIGTYKVVDPLHPEITGQVTVY